MPLLSIYSIDMESGSINKTGFGREGIAGIEAAPPLRGHRESHLLSGQRVPDVVIGMADGLTVPFALAAGLSGATTSNHVIDAATAMPVVEQLSQHRDRWVDFMMRFELAWKNRIRKMPGKARPPLPSATSWACPNPCHPTFS